MIDTTTETIDGYRVRWLSTETVDSVAAALENGLYHGIGFNPYKGWSGSIASYLASGLPLKALVLPFADKVGFSAEMIGRQTGLEMLLLSEFSGSSRIESTSLRILRLLIKPGVVFGALPSVGTVYLREATNDLLNDLTSKAPHVRVLELNAGTFSSLAGVEDFLELERLALWNLRKLRSVAALSKCCGLKSLSLEMVRNVEDLEETFACLKALRNLGLLDCGKLKSLEFLSALNLEEFRCVRTKVPSQKHPALARIPTVLIR
jgi:hypothetical protein